MHSKGHAVEALYAVLVDQGFFTLDDLKTIEKYNADFNHLIIDEHHAVDICSDCADKLVKWQGKKYSVLFPTKYMKKRYNEKRNSFFK